MSPDPVQQPAPADRVPMRIRIGWGFGGIADNYMVNVLNMLFMVIYVQYFKMPPVLAGLAFAIPRFVDALTDPLIGNISDNTRSKWGRRRPYMVAGAILSAILLPFFWTPLGGATSEVWSKNPAFIYAIVIGVIFAVTYTLYVVPYTALGYELTNDYDEKTRVLSWRMYIGLFGSLTVPWVYQLAQNDAFSNEGQGAFWVSVGVGLFVVATGLVPVLVCRERKDVQLQKTSPFGQSLKATMTNKPFVILLIAYIIIIVGLFSAGNLGAFVNIYYICGGNKDFGALLVAVSGTLGAVVSYLSMFLITAVSVRTGKKTAMFLGLGFALAGVLGAWIAMDPRWPLAQLWTTVISSMGLQGCWLMVSSMVADICDEDELKTGLRREGMFGAINGFALKAALSVTALIGGLLLQFTGFSSDEVDQFQRRTITELIEPSRAWELEEGDFKTASATFDLSATRFIEISEDKSGLEGSKLTIFSRLLKGENVFFRWYDFEDALNRYLDAARAYAPNAPESMKAELAAFIQTANEGFLTDFTEQKRVALLMKKLIIGCQALGLAMAMLIFVFYPITRKHAEETRRLLDERKANEKE